MTNSSTATIEIITGRFDALFGLPRYDESLKRGLKQAGFANKVVTPGIPKAIHLVQPVLSNVGIDLASFFQNYPISISLESDSIKHFSNHTLATLIPLHKFKNTIVTVHDIQPDWLNFPENINWGRSIPYRFFHNLSITGIRKSNQIITDTKHVKEILVTTVGIYEERIAVIPLGIDHDIFRPIPDTLELRQMFNLTNECSYILHVGTYAPRKNIPGLIRAFAKLTQIMPNVKLIKVGKPSWPIEYNNIKQLVKDLMLEDQVIFIDSVNDDELSKLYNLSDLVTYPSFYEGFGLPVLESMACGTPVITSNRSCLPEVACDAAILVDPYDVDQIANAMWLVLSQPDLAAALREKGLARAAQFTWERTARETIAVYERVLAERK